MSYRHTELIAHYGQAGPDIGAWSPGFNVHFGYCRAGFHPFDRERVLNEMNRQVLERLRLTAIRPGLIVDLGYGVDATVRYAASAFPPKRVRVNNLRSSLVSALLGANRRKCGYDLVSAMMY